MKKSFLILTFIFMSFNAFLFAEDIKFSADSMTGQTGGTGAETKLTGNAYIQTESMEIKAEKIVLSGQDYRYIKAEGGINGKNYSTNMEFTCDELSFDRNTKIAVLKGNVNLTDKDNDVKAQAQIIEYNQETDIAVIQIQISLTQKDNVCTGSYAVYHKKQQLLELSGNAQVKQKNDTFRAQYITLDMQTQDITLDGNVKGSVTSTNSQDAKKE